MGTSNPFTDSRSLMQQALSELDRLQARVKRFEQGRSQPVAIVGMGCRFPGGVDGPESYWSLLEAGRDAITEVGSERWDIEAFFDQDPDKPGKMYSRYGGFIENIDHFDPAFFGISPREAASMDPQQRLLLEVAWEALEHAGLAGSSLQGSTTGVFIGITTNDYADVLLGNGDLNSVDTYFTTGNCLNVAAGRLSYRLGLQGPSLAIDTACSSSLVSVHLACQSLRNDECDLALAGGVNVILTPRGTIATSRAHMLSPDGRCKTFDALADGYVRSEGCGLIVLQRLDDALAHGARILAVIRGSAVNQDGASGGLTVPSGPAQQKLLRRALQNAGVLPSEVSYIETHGTGTKLGDPIEINALSEVFGDAHTGQPLIVGAVKTNLGHLESAAGVAGLMKVILSLHHRCIPRHLHMHTPNPHISWGQIPIEVATSARSWPASGPTRIAGVSAFGFSGTNAHVVVEEAPREDRQSRGWESPWHLLTFSAASQASLDHLAGLYSSRLDSKDSTGLGDICFTAGVGRAHFQHRVGVLGQSADDIAEQLDLYRKRQQTPLIFQGAAGSEARRIGFLYTGQGAQYPGMGKQLYETLPTFRDAIEECNDLLRPLLDKPLIDVLYGDLRSTELIYQTAYSQPALFSLAYALTNVWRSWGIRPDMAIGHSVGEYAAACAAGVFNLQDGLKLIAERGRLMQSVEEPGGMVAVFANVQRVQAVLEGYREYVSVAAINSPEQTVISGRVRELESILKEFEAQGIRTRPLGVSRAFHSPLMASIVQEFRRCAETVHYQAPAFSIISNVTGAPVHEEVCGAGYWCRHILAPVDFLGGVLSSDAQGCDTYIEIGPLPLLLAMARDCRADTSALFLASLRPEQPDWRQMLTSLGSLYTAGAEVDWPGFYRDSKYRRVDIPRTPFERKRYWASPSRRAPGAQAAQLAPHLGRQILLPDSSEVRFEAEYSVQSPGYLSHHRLLNRLVVPAASHIAMALSAVKHRADVPRPDVWSLGELAFPQVLSLDDEETATVHLVIRPGDPDSFKIYSRTQSDRDDWLVHAEGSVRHGSVPVAGQPLQQMKNRICRDSGIDGPVYYQQFRETGYTFGPAFRWIERIWIAGEEAICRMKQPEQLEPLNPYPLYPGLIDSCFQVLASLGPLGDVEDPPNIMYVPFKIDRFTYCARNSNSPLWCHLYRCESGQPNQPALRANIRLFDDDGNVVADIEGFEVRAIARDALLERPVNDKDLLYEVSWVAAEKEQQSVSTSTNHGGAWLICADGDGFGDRLREKLRRQGEECILVLAGNDYQSTAPSTFLIDPSRAGHFERLLHDVTRQGRLLKGIVHLWSLGSRSHTDLSVSKLQESHVQSCGSVLLLVQSLAASAGPKPQLWLVTRGAQAVGEPSGELFGRISIEQAALWGMGRVLANERSELKTVCLDLDPSEPSHNDGAVLNEILAPSRENQIAYRNGVRHVARLRRFTRPDRTAAPSSGEPVRLVTSEHGFLENLRFAPATRRAPASGEVEIRVHSVGLNFRDVLNALGMLQSQLESVPFGGECSGTVVAIGEGVTEVKVGDEVIAALALGCFGSFVTARSEFVVSKPASLSLEEAATIPVAFLTARYGLVHLANIGPGDRVLIHAAAGGVGLAAVQVAQAAGAEVFATASPAKWDYLKSLGIQHVMNSRTLDFANEVASLTNGEGVDIVLNSLNGDFVGRSFDCLAKGGRFVEIGKIGTWSTERVSEVRPDVAYFRFDLVELSQTRPDIISRVLMETVEAVSSNVYRPLLYKLFQSHKTVQAFRHMAQARHTGKIIVAAPDEHSYGIRSDRTYLITGGMGALGLRTACWMAQEGARHLILTRHQTAITEASQKVVGELERSGVQVLVLPADITNSNDVARLLATAAAEAPPIAGIIHAAGALDDGLMVNYDWDRFGRVMAPKVSGAWSLHLATMDLPLDFFVLYSSVASLLGPTGQCSYAAGNAFLDALAYLRRSLGLPGTVINWGPWSEAGMAAGLARPDAVRLETRGVQPLSTFQAFSALKRTLRQDLTQVAVVRVKWPALLASGNSAAPPVFLEGLVSGPVEDKRRGSLFARLRAADSESRTDLLRTDILQMLAQVLGFEGRSRVSIDPKKGFFELGMDSLSALEFSNMLQVALDRSFSSTLAFKYSNVDALVVGLLKEMEFPITETLPKEVPEQKIEKASADVRSLSPNELESMIDDELNRLRKEAAHGRT